MMPSTGFFSKEKHLENIHNFDPVRKRGQGAHLSTSFRASGFSMYPHLHPRLTPALLVQRRRELTWWKVRLGICSRAGSENRTLGGKVLKCF